MSGIFDIIFNKKAPFFQQNHQINVLNLSIIGKMEFLQNRIIQVNIQI